MNEFFDVRAREVVTLRYEPGTVVDRICEHALKHSEYHNCIVRFECNGVQLEAYRGLSLEFLLDQYRRKLQAAERARDAMRELRKVDLDFADSLLRQLVKQIGDK